MDLYFISHRRVAEAAVIFPNLLAILNGGTLHFWLLSLFFLSLNSCTKNIFFSFSSRAFSGFSLFQKI